MRRTSIVGSVVGLALVLAASAARSDGGYLDRTFGTPGRVTTAIAPKVPSTSYGEWRDGYEDGMAVATDAAGRLVVVGASFTGVNYDVAVARYLPDGRLDTSFGSSGTRLTAIGTSNDFGMDVAIDTLGRIVVAASSHNGTNFDFAVVRYTANGNLDTSFSGDGKTTVAIGLSTNDHARAVALDPAGRIVVAGTASNGVTSYAALTRFTASGALDTSFSGDGKLAEPGNVSAYDVVVDSTGRPIVAGAYSNGQNAWASVLRYTVAGAPDVGGTSYSGANADFLLLRYGAAGGLDTTFGDNLHSVGECVTGGCAGWVTTPMSGGKDIAVALTLDGSGRILLAGGAVRGFAIARYLAD